MKRLRRVTLVYVTALVILGQTACQHNFSTDLRVALAASGPLIESLNLGSQRGAVIADFTDLANGAATFANELKACGSATPCKLDAATKFESLFDSVIARGHFGLSPKLQTVENILRGIIASARIYFGGESSSSNARMAGKPVTEDSIKAQIDELKKAMTP